MTAKRSASTRKLGSGAADPYAGLGQVLAAGFDPALASDEYDLEIDLDDIEIQAQHRTEFEDSEQTLDDLGDSLKWRQLQQIIVRPSPAGSPKPYQLVAGERRCRSARARSIPRLRARVMTLTDDEVRQVQAAENIHRKNLTLQEEARQLQSDIAALGSVAAYCEKHHKNKVWVSKRLALLDLGPQAQRLITEHISADEALIRDVRQLERHAPAAARDVVDTLKAREGRENARDLVTQARRAAGAKRPERPAVVPQAAPGRDAATTLAKACAAVAGGTALRAATGGWPADLQAEVRASLAAAREAGLSAANPARSIVHGLRTGLFAAEGYPAAHLVAFILGATGRSADLYSVLEAFRSE